MNNAAKFLRVVSRLPAKRYVSTIRPQGDQVVYKGVTYTKMLHPHTLTSVLANFHWKLYWQKFAWGRMIVYAFITVAPFAIYTNYKGEPIDRIRCSLSSSPPVLFIPIRPTRSMPNLTFLPTPFLRDSRETTTTLIEPDSPAVFSALYKAKREEKAAKKAGKKKHH